MTQDYYTAGVVEHRVIPPTSCMQVGNVKQKNKKNGKNSFTGKIDQLWEGRDKIWVQDVDFFLLPGLLHLRGGAGGNATKY